jgi:hypothetical protein
MAHKTTAGVPSDAQIIARLGGPAKVAELLGYDKSDGGIQRVCNWLKRGIPARVKVEHPDLFMPASQSRKRATA